MDLKVIKKLGQGAWGVVKLVQDVKTEKYYVLKTVEINDKTRILIERETNVLRKIREQCAPYLLCMESFATNGDKAQFLFTYIPNMYELKIISQTIGSQFDINMNFVIIEKLLLGLSQIHELNVVHRDIKPGNILIDPNKLLAIYIDFGLACTSEDKKCLKNVCGSPRFIAPEALNKIDPEDFDSRKASDIWALGLTFLTLCDHKVLESTLFKGIFSVNQIILRIKTLTQRNIDELLFAITRNKRCKFYTELVKPMLIVDWKKRATAKEMLSHLYKLSESLLPTVEDVKNRIDTITGIALEKAADIKFENPSHEESDEKVVCLK